MSRPPIDRLQPNDLPVDFGRCRLVGLLGEGGMGRVFDAVLTGPSGFRKEIALKVIRASVASRHEHLAPELAREARIGGLLRHPNIVDVYDHGVTDGQPWIAMERVDGVGLEHLIAAVGALPPSIALEIGIGICAGLDRAHELRVDDTEAGLIHRDLKPSNVLVSRHGEVKLMDFGIAKLSEDVGRTETGVSKGTPAYMSPEQASARPLDRRSDLFAAGAVLFEMLTGERLLEGDSVMQVLMSVISVDERLADGKRLAPAEAAIPGAARVLRSALAADPAARYRTAADMGEALRALRYGVTPGPLLAALVEDVVGGGDGSDVHVPERLTQVTLSATLEYGVPTNLQPDSTSFIGRAEELDQLSTAFGDGARLVTLIGPGGTGKTRLSRKFGVSVIERFTPGGVWFCDLSDVRSLAPLAQAVAAPLGVSLRGSGTTDSQVGRIGDALGSRGQLLLILDNFEQIVEHASATIERWLQAAPLLRILVTSRERLRLSAETPIELLPLPEEAAVQLFEERARTADAGFDLEPVRTAVVQIVTRLDRIPLAIELAAARVAVLPPPKLLERLSQRFRILRKGIRGARARQATLEGAVAWSWDLLTPPERSALTQCSVFRGGFTLEDAEEVLDLTAWPDAPWELDVIEALRDKSLLHSVGTSDEARFSMYETIREFADARLDAETDRRACWARHARVILCRVGGVRPGDPQLDSAPGRRRLLAQKGNLEAIVERFVDHDGDLTLRAGLALASIERSYGTPDSEMALMLRVRADRTDADLVLRTYALNSLAFSYRAVGDNNRSLELYERAVGLAEGSSDRRLLAISRRALSFVASAMGRADEAEAHARESLAMFRELGERFDEGGALTALAGTLANQGRATEARSTYLEALQIHQEVGARAYEAAATVNVGVLIANSGEIVEAEEWFRRALALFEALEMAPAACLTQGNIGAIGLELGRYEDAATDLRRALRSARELGYLQQQCVVLNNMGLLEHLRGRLDRALDLLEEGWGLARRSDPRYRGFNRTWMGAALMELGRYADARAAFERAEREFASERRERPLRQLAAMRAALEAADGHIDGAEAMFDRVLEDIGRAGDPIAQHLATVSTGHLDLARSRAAATTGDSDAATLHREIAEARLEVVEADQPRARAVRAADRLLRAALAQR